MDNLPITTEAACKQGGGPRSLVQHRGHDRITSVVAAVFEIPVGDLHKPTRGCANVAQARQMAMYLARVGLGMTLSEAGRLFGRDRTTAAHACRLVEDLRDNPLLDAILTVMEHTVRDQKAALDADAAQ